MLGIYAQSFMTAARADLWQPAAPAHEPAVAPHPIAHINGKEAAHAPAAERHAR